MKLKIHFTIIVVGAALFAIYCVSRQTENIAEVTWYRHPLVVPMAAGYTFGSREHMNATAFYSVWIAECLVAGVALDLIAWFVRRRRSQSRGSRNTASL